MKKFIFAFVLLFSFIFKVSASELDISNLGYSSCIHNDSLSYTCYIDNSGVAVYTSNTLRVSNYFLVSSGGSLITEDSSSSLISIAYYDSNYNFISLSTTSISSDLSYDLVVPNNGFYARISWNISRYPVVYVSDDFNDISSLNYAIGILSDTVKDSLLTYLWWLVIPLGIFISFICFYFILRIVRGG